MKIAMLILALFGPPQGGDWRVTVRVMVPPDHCQAERAKFNHPSSRYRIVCDDQPKFVAACATDTQLAFEP